MSEKEMSKKAKIILAVIVVLNIVVFSIAMITVYCKLLPRVH